MPTIMGISGVQGKTDLGGFNGYHMLTGVVWSGDRKSGSRVVAGPPQLRAVRLARISDETAPQIWQLMLTNAKLGVEIVWLRTGVDGPIAYQNLLLEGAQITAASLESGGTQPIERLDLTYEKVTLTYIRYDDALSGVQSVVVYDLPSAVGA
jgi:type VI protein secretion system component Hcp